MANVTVKALKGVFLSGGRALAAGETAEMDEAQARAYPGDELEILGDAGAGEPGGDDPPAADGQTVWASPEAEALAVEAGVPAADIEGTGKDGAIRSDDVRTAIAAREEKAGDEPNADPKPGADGPA